jgi:hypothetical protein
MDTLPRCVRCGLPESYPGVRFGPDDICNYCRYYDLYSEREAAIAGELKKGFIKTIRKIKKENHRYHCVVAYSGGKDSTFLLQYLKNTYGLKIVAHLFDNGFISTAARKNIKNVTERLKIKLVVTRPPGSLMKKIFNYTLTEPTPYPKEFLAMLSPLCVACQAMVFGTTLKTAKRLKTPLMFIGYTPGQYPVISLENYMKVESCVFFSSEVYRDDPMDIIKIGRDSLHERFGDPVDDYFFKSQYIRKGEFVPRVLFPFHALLDYDEKTIYAELAKIGWERPRDTDPCSTNCLINTLGNYAAVRKMGFHPYIGELSFLVRAGKMSREEALLAEKVDDASFAMNCSLKRLDLHIGDLS